MEINLPMNPPINNNIQGNIYDKLDAVTFEKVRMANSLLDSRRSLQEKVINKYRKDVEKVHMHQKERLKREYKKIRTKRPDYHYDEQESTARSRDRSVEGGRQRSLSESSNSSFCHRYYAHHYNYKDRTRLKRKDDDKNKPKHENDHFNTTLRLFFLNMMNHAQINMARVNEGNENDNDVGTPNRERGDINRIHVKPLSYDPRFPDDDDKEAHQEATRSRSVDTLFKEGEDVCEELKDIDNSSDENDVFANSLNDSCKISLGDSASTLDKFKGKPKTKLSHSLNVPSYTSIPEESRIDLKEDKELWRRSKRAFEKIFTGLL